MATSRVIWGPFPRIFSRGDDEGVDSVHKWDKGLIVRDELAYPNNQQGFWLFSGPSRVKAMWAAFDEVAAKRGRPPAWHEIVPGGAPQLFKLDIDAPRSALARYSDAAIRDQYREAFADAFNARFGAADPPFVLTPSEIVVYDASSKVKLSLHLVTPTVAAPDAAVARALAISTAEIAPPEFGEHIDLQVYARGMQGFRLPGGAKRTAPERPLRLVCGEDPRLLVSVVPPEVPVVCDACDVPAQRNSEVPDEDVQRALKVTHDVWSGSFTYRGAVGGVISFDRTLASPCLICRDSLGVPEVHHRDNTLMFRIAPEADACDDTSRRGRRVLALCRHAPGQSVAVGVFESDSVWGGDTSTSAADLFDERYLDQAIASAMNAAVPDLPPATVEGVMDFLISGAAQSWSPAAARAPTESRPASRPAAAVSSPGPAADPIAAAIPGMRELVYSAPTMRPYPSPPDDVLVVGGMGAGKTKALLQYIGAHFPNRPTHPARVLLVTFRRSLARATHSLFRELGFELYSNVATHTLSPETHPRLVIQVESLHRLETRGVPPPDLIVLDESESIIAQLGSGLSRNERRVLAVFDWLLRRSSHLIALDAHLGRRTADVLGHLRYGGGRKPPQLVRNTLRRGLHETYRLTTSHPLWLKSLLESVRSGRRVVLPTNSLAEAEAAARILRETTRDDGTMPVVLLYSSRTSPAVRARDFADVNTAWKACDVVIYTPTVSAGVSFEVPSHFDELFALFTSASCDALAAVQMLGRVRSLQTGRLTICLQGRPPVPPLPTDEAGLLHALDMRRASILGGGAPIYTLGDDGYPAPVRTPHLTIWLANQAVVNESRNSYAEVLARLLAERGGRLARLDAGADESEIRGLRALARTARAGAAHEEARGVSEAAELSSNQATRLQLAVRSRAGEMTAAVRHALAKYWLRCTYRIAILGLNPKWVAAYSPPDVLRMFRDLRSVAGRVDVSSESIARTITTSGGVTRGAAWETAIFEQSASGNGLRALRFDLYAWAASAFGVTPHDLLSIYMRRGDLSVADCRATAERAAGRLEWAARAAADVGIPSTSLLTSLQLAFTGAGPRELATVALARSILLRGLGISLRPRGEGITFAATPRGKLVTLAEREGVTRHDEELRPVLVLKN